MVKWGIFYRSDALCHLFESDKDVLSSLGIKTVVDFRNNTEVEKNPDCLFGHVKYIHLSPNADIAQLASGNIMNDEKKVAELVKLSKTVEGRKQLIDRQNDMETQMRDLVFQEISNEKYSQFLNLFLEQRNVPILHHCRGGKDRAGFGTVIVLMALNVSKETIMNDYLLTKEYMAERIIRRMNEYRQYTDNQFVLDYLSSLMQAKENYLNAAFDEIEKVASSFDNYLKKYLKMTDKKIELLRTLYLE